MNILVTLNSTYLKPLRVMLKSMFINNPTEEFHIYLIHSRIAEEDLTVLDGFITRNGGKLFVISIPDDYFTDAPLRLHYSKEMYYRLLACKFLPPELDKILYLDPDIIVINELRALYQLDLTGYLYAAAYHRRVPLKEINKIRLKAHEMEEYFNSGVLLMNLERQRERMNEQEIFTFVAKYKNRLVMPDQDVLNSLYAKEIKKIDEIKYNYDTRYYRYYKLISKGVVDMDYVINNTSILHFCGKKKPWHKNYRGVFHSLYKHYEKQAFR
ncbi:MAG TPA: glycosyltransferase family 8 protein [Firmicutes bacterium]|nr:glycosyltransferase family 8 protein [Bacillota bacterium]